MDIVAPISVFSRWKNMLLITYFWNKFDGGFLGFCFVAIFQNLFFSVIFLRFLTKKVTLFHVLETENVHAILENKSNDCHNFLCSCLKKTMIYSQIQFWQECGSPVFWLNFVFGGKPLYFCDRSMKINFN